MATANLSTALVEYQGRLQAIQSGIADSHSAQGRLGAVTAALAIVLAIGIIAVFRKPRTAWLPLSLTPAVVWSFRGYAHRRKEFTRLLRLRRMYEAGLERLNGSWAGKGATGDEFSRADHLYERDLNIFGSGSMFELLCTARTGLGRRRLASYLLHLPERDETLARQEAVRELESRTELREEIATLGEYSFQDAEWQPFHDWLEAPHVAVPRVVSWVLLLNSCAIVPLVLIPWLAPPGAGLWTAVAPFLWAAAALQVGCALLLVSKMKPVIEGMRTLAHEVAVFRRGLQLMESQQFQSAKLAALVESVKGSAGRVRRLEQLILALDQCGKDWFLLPARVLLAPQQLAISAERWKSRHAAPLKRWLEAWGEFEALNSLGGYAHEHPEDVFPEIGDGEVVLDADALGHPLIPESKCVRNDVELGGARRFYLVSGSNMAGKSTLLRAIGLNAVLAAAGAPVRARRARMSCFAVGASVSIADSLAEGKSKFLAEVERLREMLRATGGPKPVLFVIDEILAGTNSRDRRVAAEAFVRALAGAGAIGALSTHDLALAEIAEDPKLGGTNVHMESSDPADPFAFDYRLQPGVSTHSNALAIARLAGVAV